MRVLWVVYGPLDQPTGGYLYDRIVVDGLRDGGDRVDVVDPRAVAPSFHGFDVVVGDALCAAELADAFERAVESGPPRIFLVHHLPSWEIERSDRDALRRGERRAMRAADAAIVTSSVSAGRLRDEYPGAAVHVVVPGADRLLRHPREPRRVGTRARAIELLFVGSLVARKRLPILLEAIDRLEEPELSLTIVGDDSRDPAHAREVAATIRRSPTLTRCVNVVGVLADDALARAMARADALVLPSSLEGYGMVLAEALHAGLPVIAARPAAEAAGISDHAGVVTFDDERRLEGALRRFTHDPALRAAMHAAAAAARLPRWSPSVAEFRRVLSDVVRGCRWAGPRSDASTDREEPDG